MTRIILTLNTGSSSVKFHAFEADFLLNPVFSGKVTGIGDTPVFTGQDQSQHLPQETTQASALSFVLEWILNHEPKASIVAAVHRVVHGGRSYVEPVLLDTAIMADLHALSPLAPLHQPHNLRAVEALWQVKPELKQYACFDTAFHAGIDELHHSFALPEKIRNAGVRRYGFHGLSYDWISHDLKRCEPDLWQGRVVVAHLGNGASMCAMRAGQSIDTTMGMTALDGLPMGTRSGSLDAGAIIYMQREMGLSLEAVEHILYFDSGLKGLSNETNDVATLLKSTTAQSVLALDYFVWKCTQNIAALAVTLGGLDALVFTGGIGENAQEIRQRIINGLDFFPAFEVRVLPAQEERHMAGQIYRYFLSEL